MKKVITAAFAITLVLLSAAFVANCSYSSNTPTAHNNTPPPPDSLKTKKPKIAHLGLIPFEQWKDETQYVLSMLDDTTGLSKDNQFMLVKESSFHQGQQIKNYAQLYKGVDVWAGMVNLIFEQDTLFDKTEHLYKVSLDVNPSITEVEALAKLQTYKAHPVKDKKLLEQKGLVIMKGYSQKEDDFHLCWTFIFEEYKVYIDAHNGEVIRCIPTTIY
jgi:Zn-dependent metalloprotease